MRLSRENIDRASEDIKSILLDYSDDPKWRLRIALIIEDFLLQYLDAFGEGIDFQIENVKRWGQNRLTLHVKADSLNPLESEDSMNRYLLENIGFPPTWQYKQGINQLTFRLEKHKNNSYLISFIGAIVLGILLGKLATYLPDSGVSLCETYLSPLSDKVMGGLVAFTVVYIFLSVVNGFVGMGSMQTLKTTGLKVLSTTIKATIVIILLSIIVMLPFVPVTWGGVSQFSLAPIYELIIDIVATDIVSPFMTGNILQVFYLAVCVGLALLFFIEQTTEVQNLLRQFSSVVGVVVSTIAKLVPIVIFVSVFKLAISGTLNQVWSFSKYILLVIVVSLVNAIVMLLITCVKVKVSPLTLIKKLFPAFSLGFITASSLVCFIPKCEIAETKLGVDKTFINVAMPMLQIILPMSYLLTLLPMGMSCSEMYNISITPLSILQMAIVAWLIALSAPPVAGGGAIVFAVFFVQLGIPMEGLAIALALEVITDHFVTGVNQVLALAVLLQSADKTDLINRAFLRAK